MTASATDLFPRISAPRPTTLTGMDGLLERAKLLNQEDRTLLESTFINNMTLRQISRLNGRSAGTLSRTVKRLIKQLNHPTALALLDARCPLPPTLKQLGVEHFLVGLTARAVAEKHQMDLRLVRKALQSIDVWMMLRTHVRL